MCIIPATDLRFVANGKDSATYNSQCGKRALGKYMRYEFVSAGNLVQLTLEGDIELESWQSCFWEMKLLFKHGRHTALLINAEAVTEFRISNQMCSEVMPGFAQFACTTAIYSSSPLIFGMLRVVQGYSHNDSLRVFRSRQDALDAIRPFLVSPCIDQLLPE